MSSTNALRRRGVALAISQLLAAPAFAQVDPISVNDQCSLIDAIRSAETDSSVGGCSSGGNAIDVIVIEPGSMIEFQTGYQNGTPADPNPFTATPFITSNILIRGGNSIVRRSVDADQAFRLFAVTSSGDLSLQDLTVTNGELPFGGAGIYLGANASLSLERVTVSGNTVLGNENQKAGGGLFSNGGNLSIVNSVFSGNEARNGGAIFVDDDTSNRISIRDSTISSNIATRYGGGLYLNSGATIDNSEVSKNQASVRGGGFYTNQFLSVNDSAIQGNRASTGGGVYLGAGAQMRVRQSTISGNSTSSNGGGFYARDADYANITNSTISGNTAFNGGGFQLSSTLARAYQLTLFDNVSTSASSVVGGGFFAGGSSTVFLTNSIIAGSEGNDCGRTPSTSSVLVDSTTIIQDGTCNATRSGNPRLRPLENNGGPTKTHALRFNSKARDTGLDCLETDQRGRTREPKCDVGAFEFLAGDEEKGFFVIPLPEKKAVVVPE